MPQSKEVHKEYMRARREGSQEGSQNGEVHSDIYLEVCKKQGVVPVMYLKPIDTSKIVQLNCGEFYKREWVDA